LHSKTTYSGSLAIRKPNQGRMRFESVKDHQVYMQGLMCDKELFLYDWRTKCVTQVSITREGNRIAIPSSMFDRQATMPRLGFEALEMIHNFEAAEVKKSFSLQYCPRPGDENYIYITIRPVAERVSRFAEMQLALYSPQIPKPYTPYLPAGVRVKRFSGEILEWKFSEQRLGVKLDKDAFEHKMPDGDGWKLEKVPQVPKN